MKKYISIIVILLLLSSLIACLVFSYSNLNGVKDSVVYIESIDAETIKSGSGFVYRVKNNKNYIVTSYHVIQGYTDIYVYNNNKEKVEASILNYDEYTDIAILAIENSLGLKESVIGNSDNVSENDEVYAVGTPLDINNINTVSYGVILSNKSYITLSTSIGSRNIEVIEVDTLVDSGNSGGPLLNKSDEVIGMMFLNYCLYLCYY